MPIAEPPAAVPPIFAPPHPLLSMAPLFSPFSEHQGFGRDRQRIEIIQCKEDSDCEDNNPCTLEGCHEEECDYKAVPGCAACSANSDCDQNDICIIGTCGDGICSYESIPDCGGCGGSSPICQGICPAGQLCGVGLSGCECLSTSQCGGIAPVVAGHAQARKNAV